MINHSLLSASMLSAYALKSRTLLWSATVSRPTAPRLFAFSVRSFKTHSPLVDAYEEQIANLLKTELKSKDVSVTDISGGCGSMFDIDIKSNEFKGLSKLKQQKLVYKILKEEMSKWHGVHLKTNVPIT